MELPDRFVEDLTKVARRSIENRLAQHINDDYAHDDDPGVTVFDVCAALGAVCPMIGTNADSNVIPDEYALALLTALPGFVGRVFERGLRIPVIAIGTWRLTCAYERDGETHVDVIHVESRAEEQSVVGEFFTPEQRAVYKEIRIERVPTFKGKLPEGLVIPLTPFGATLAEQGISQTN